ncbi:MAG: hypothetical protein AWM53_00972 [Candidatus Dichloromethanomonas elyunquensis]|nr:MAG: hypothetical protein AWM53_00972 [Candidatus Dichloromethanomonas elyunquensis]
MMFIGVVIFMVGLFLVLDRNNHISNTYLPKKEDKALNILRERYARGEITTEEFIAGKNALQA